MPADIDWGQVIFLILVVIVGFFRWLGELIQQRKEARERQLQNERPLTRAPGPPPAPRPARPLTPAEDPFREFKDLFEQLRPPAPQAPPAPPQRPAPPPLPPGTLTRQRQPLPAPPAPHRKPPAPAAAVPQAATQPRLASAYTQEIHSQNEGRTSRRLRELRRDLRSPEALRQAVLVREILGAPRALRPD